MIFSVMDIHGRYLLDYINCVIQKYTFCKLGEL